MMEMGVNDRIPLSRTANPLNACDVVGMWWICAKCCQLPSHPNYLMPREALSQRDEHNK